MTNYWCVFKLWKNEGTGNPGAEALTGIEDDDIMKLNFLGTLGKS